MLSPKPPSLRPNEAPTRTTTLNFAVSRRAPRAPFHSSEVTFRNCTIGTAICYTAAPIPVTLRIEENLLISIRYQLSN